MSIKLPRHLAVWEPQLRIFPAEIALGLAPMVQKIASLVGPLSGRHTEGLTLPDGFAGLARRGSYERLIASDWMLADELPEEFMRRSVMGEHLFWKLAYLEPTQSRSTLALFDAGPEQLGTPRIAHLAALAVLAARARVANSGFHWGVLQNHEPNLLPGVNLAEVEMMLQARGVVSAQAQDFEQWLNHPILRERGGEIWAVGSARLLQIAPSNVSLLIVSEVIAPGERRLLVECRPAGRHTRSIELALPETRLCVQLLRDPFGIAAPAVRKAGRKLLPHQLLFSYSGRKLYGITKDGGIMALPVPNSPREIPGNAKYYSAKGTVMGVAQTKRTTWVISTADDRPEFYADNFGKLSYHVEQLGASSAPGTGEYHRQVMSGAPPPVLSTHGNRLLPCIWYNQVHKEPASVYLLDNSGNLLRFFQRPSGEKRCEIVATQVLALTRARSRSGILYVSSGHEQGGLFWMVGGMGQERHAFSLDAKLKRAFFGYAHAGKDLAHGVLALGCQGDIWELWQDAREPVKVPPGFTVHGAMKEENYEAALIVVEDDGRTLGLLGAHGLRHLTTASAPIVAVTGSHQYPLVAYGTEAGEITIYSVPRRKTVLQFQGGAI